MTLLRCSDGGGGGITNNDPLNSAYWQGIKGIVAFSSSILIIFMSLQECRKFPSVNGTSGDEYWVEEMTSPVIVCDSSPIPLLGVYRVLCHTGCIWFVLHFSACTAFSCGVDGMEDRRGRRRRKPSEIGIGIGTGESAGWIRDRLFFAGSFRLIESLQS